MKKFFMVLLAVFCLSSTAYSARIRWFTALTGGGSGALDKIDGGGLNDGDGAIVIDKTNNKAYFYTLDDSSGVAESSPSTISPDSNAGTKRWILTKVGEFNSLMDTEAELESQLTDTSNIIVATEIDTFSEVDTLVADKSLINIEDSFTIIGDYDIGGGTLQIPNSSSLPATCEIGNVYMDTNATSGQRQYLCESADSWVLQGAAGSGDITDVFNCGTGNCDAVVLSDGDLLNMSSVAISSTAEGLILPQHATDCSTAGGTAEGQVCWEADNDTLWIGDGSSVSQISGGNVSDNTSEAITGVWEVQDDTLFNFGNDADFGIRYDETTDNRLEIISSSANTTNISIVNGGAGVTDMALDGAVTATNGYISGRSTTPMIKFGDSDCTDTDDNVKIFSNCTDTGTGTEDCDLTWQQQIAGTITTFMLADADGNIEIGSSTHDTDVKGDFIGSKTGAFTGTLTGEVGITLDTASTIDISSAANARGQMRVNNDNDVIDYTLPPAEAGLNICFYSRYAAIVTVDMDDGSDTLILNGTALTAGNAIDSAGGAGDFICLLAIDSTYWLSLGRTGTWADGGAD